MLLKFTTIQKYASLCKYTRHFSNVNTIFALSSGQGKCGVAVIRVSGPQAGLALKRVTGMEGLPKPRYAILRSIKDPLSGEVLDKGIVMWFPGPRSFTGEDSCELQIHGGRAVISAILKALGSVHNLRLAEPGEFTRRAFYNGKLDLTEVEGIADLLSAETEIQRKQAFLQTEGHLSKIYEKWKRLLIQCLASIEAHVDFSETETLESNMLENVTRTTKHLSEEIEKHLSDGRKGERRRTGVKTVILGEPNVGKSSLLNILCQRPAAIVTPVEGTTRDVLEVMLDINGYPMLLADTAGLRFQTTDVVEKEGINRALQACQEADLILLVISCLKYLSWCKTNSGKNFTDFVSDHITNLNINGILNSTNNFGGSFSKQCLVIANKFDLVQNEDAHVFENLNISLISCKTEDGFPLLLEEITSKLLLLCGEPSKEHPSMNQLRHRQHLLQCLKYLKLFLEQSKTHAEIDCVLMAEELRKALRQLGKITGTVTTEQLLDVIFREFCIGK